MYFGPGGLWDPLLHRARCRCPAAETPLQQELGGAWGPLPQLLPTLYLIKGREERAHLYPGHGVGSGLCTSSSPSQSSWVQWVWPQTLSQPHGFPAQGEQTPPNSLVHLILVPQGPVSFCWETETSFHQLHPIKAGRNDSCLMFQWLSDECSFCFSEASLHGETTWWGTSCE